VSFTRYAILVLVLVVLGLITVWEHLRLLSIGYEVSELRSRRVRVEEEARVQERRIEAIATPGETAARAKTLGLDLVPPRTRAARQAEPVRPSQPERPLRRSRLGERQGQ
jgi:hypothetical protein